MEKCKHYRRCNGCQLQNLNYDEQLAYKQRKLEYLFRDFGVPDKIIGMENPLHYRNKSQYSFLKRGKNEVRYGLYQSKTKTVSPIISCQLDTAAAASIMEDICKLAVSFKLSVYDYQTQKGFLRHVLIRRGYYSREIMVVLVCGSQEFPKKSQFINALLSRHPEINTIVFSVSASEKMVLGKKQEILFGDGIITDTLCGKSFTISPSSFYQVNTLQAQRLYERAFELARLKESDVLIDAYCGTGTIGILAAGLVKHVIGVESNPAAVRDAVENAKRNKIQNIQFHCGDASHFMSQLAADKKQADVVILDPPRAGTTKKCMDALLKLAPERIVYISCAPQTQLRDLNYLTSGGYKVANISAFDLFPMTKHVETIVLLTK